MQGDTMRGDGDAGQHDAGRHDAGRHGVRRGVGRAATSVALSVSLITLAACTSGPAPSLSPSPPPKSHVAPHPSAGAPTATATPGPRLLEPIGTSRVIAENLEAPWSMVRLASGSTLISERDTAKLLEREPDGTVRDVGTVAGVHPGGEAGLLGLAVLPAQPPDDRTWLYAYFTSADDNRVVRMPLEGEPGFYTLGEPDVILRGIPKASNHDGGRIKFGPDGMLYVTAGDANQSDHAQELSSLGGKILRLQPDGQVPPDNPFPGSYVYSWGHRNPQGIAWTSDGTMWASEFGQNTWDELNIITPGSNYGWPDVEGKGGHGKYVDPVLQWPTNEASPSGLTVVGDTLFMAGLGGRRLWVIYPDDAATNGGTGARAVDYFDGTYGRIRDVVPGPNGTLWFMTNNTDGRGTPMPGDDKIYQVKLAPVPEGGP